MGSVTIIVIIPIAIILILASSLVGSITGGDRTQVVLPYEPEKGIVWECDVQDYTPIELVDTEIDGNKQIFYFKSTFSMDMVRYFAGIAKDLITKEDPDPEYSYGEYYTVTFTDENGNERRFCYCRMTHPLASPWILYLNEANASDCISYCSNARCAATFLSNGYANVRKGLYDSVGR
jgi:hypothetical protein